MIDDDLPCNELVELVTEHLEGALSPAQHHRIVGHLAECEGCAAYLDQIRETRSMLAALPPEPVSRRLPADVLEVYRRWRAERVPRA